MPHDDILQYFWQGQAPEKVTGVDLFYLMSMDRGTANVLYLLAQYLFRHSEGGRVELGYLEVISLDVLQLILDWLNIYKRISDTWDWVAARLERQSDAAADAPRAAEDALAVDEGAQADLAPVQAPQPPPPAPKTITQRIARLEEEVQELRWSIVGLRGDVDMSITD
nr:hypothetical protein [Tanacetum cinerariifolium]